MKKIFRIIIGIVIFNIIVNVAIGLVKKLVREEDLKKFKGKIEPFLKVVNVKMELPVAEVVEMDEQ